MTTHYTYIQAIGEGWPGVHCHAAGDGSDYVSIVWEGGDPLPAQAVLDAWMAQAEISSKQREIQQERDRRKWGGIYIASAGHWFAADDCSRIQYMGMIVAGGGLPFGVMWRCLDGASVQMSTGLAAQIMQEIVARDVSIFSVCEQHKSQAALAEHPALYNFLDNSPAWPQIYAE